MKRQKQTLSDKQRLALSLLVAGQTDTQVAKRVGAVRQTVWTWRCRSPEFAAELNKLRAELWEAGQDQLRSLIPAAIGVLSRAIEDEGSLSAAVHVLRAAGVYGQAMEPAGSVEPHVVEAEWELATREAEDSRVERELRSEEQRSRLPHRRMMAESLF